MCGLIVAAWFCYRIEYYNLIFWYFFITLFRCAISIENHFEPNGWPHDWVYGIFSSKSTIRKIFPTIKNQWLDLITLVGGHVRLYSDSDRIVWPEIPHRNISRFNDGSIYPLDNVFKRRSFATILVAHVHICIREKMLFSINRDVKLTATWSFICIAFYKYQLFNFILFYFTFFLIREFLVKYLYMRQKIVMKRERKKTKTYEGKQKQMIVEHTWCEYLAFVLIRRYISTRHLNVYSEFRSPF